MKDTYMGKKVEHDPNFEWILDRIVKDGWGSTKISKEYEREFGRRLTVSKRSIDRYIKYCKVNINTAARKMNRMEMQNATRKLKNGKRQIQPPYL